MRQVVKTQKKPRERLRTGVFEHCGCELLGVEWVCDTTEYQSVTTACHRENHTDASTLSVTN